MKQPILQFDFQDTQVIFTEPINIIQTNELSEVEHCLMQVQSAVNNGLYVAGYLSYEVTYAFSKGAITKVNNNHPLLWFGVFKAPYEGAPLFSNNNDYHVGTWNMMQSKAQYEAQFAKIMEAIQNGTLDQINYTVPFESTFSGNSYRYYERLRKAQQASYNAYLQLGDIDIISASPELFFDVHDGDITVKPMKGTIHRGKTVAEDVANKQWLQQSSKNKFENELIAALMQQELAPITEPNSVAPTSLYDVEQYPTVYQMTSTIKGKLKKDTSITQILRTLFPCGSISGVPKKETLQLIPEFEPHPREIYCGAIGYITPEENAVFNVPIRTVTIDKLKNQATYGAGGAITAHSNVVEEYEEMVTKTKVLEMEREDFQLLETLGLIDGQYLVLEEHIERLSQSARYFNFEMDVDDLMEILRTTSASHPKGKWRVRLTVSAQGDIVLNCVELEATDNTQVVLAQKPIHKSNVFHYHKTTHRMIYNEHRCEDMFDVILWNEDDEITEFSIGNIVLEMDGTYYTPPIESGVLPGTFRKSLLQAGVIKEKIMHLSDLQFATNIWLINSVRGWVKVHL